MAADSLIRLLVLSAIWGGSFLFMRIASPALGPAYLVEGRVAFGAMFLLILAIYFKKDKNLLLHWKHYTVLGFFNSALPFFLFGVAALHLTASQLSVLNATAPIWGCLIGLIVGNETLSKRRSAGLILGVLGVLIHIENPVDTGSGGDYYLSVLLSLAAAFSYGVATNYAKKAKRIEPFLNAYGSMWFSTLMVAPALLFFPMRSEPTVEAIGAVVAIGVLCSGIAYLLYFRLIQDIGPASALTVTFLIPVFATMWGVVFLHETLTMRGFLGMLIVIAGTALVTGFRFSSLVKSPAN